MAQGITQQMAGINLQQEYPSMAPKPSLPAKDDRGTVTLVTNAYAVALPEDTNVYPYDLTLFLRVRNRNNEERTIKLVKEKTDDYTITNSKNKCRQAFGAMANKYKTFFASAGRMFYDLQSLIYFTEPIKFAQESTKVLRFAIGENEFGHYSVAEFSGFGTFELVCEIKPYKKGGPVALRDFKFLSPEIVDFSIRHDLAQFIEVGSSQAAYLNSEKRITLPGGVSFEKDSGTLMNEGAKQVWAGAQKSVKFRENINDPATIVLDAKRSLFHIANVNLADKVYAMKVMNEVGEVSPTAIGELSKQLKKLYVEVRHLNPRKVFQIVEVLPQNCETFQFPLDSANAEGGGRMISVHQYFIEKYNHNLTYPRSPVVAVRAGGKQNIHYPMEVLYVCPNQRVTTGQQTPKDVADMIRACAVLPADRLKEIRAQAQKLQLHSERSPLAEIGVKISPQLLTVTGRTLGAPSLAYGRGQGTPAANGTWRSGERYIKPATLSRWAVFHLTQKKGGPDYRFVTEFAAAMINECKRKGMHVEQPWIGAIEQRELTENFEYCANGPDGRYEFMFFIQDSRLTCHKEIKALERRFEIITQDLNMKTAQNVVEKRQKITLENIINKTNVKLGGLNYNITVGDPAVGDMFNKGRLYLGIQLNRANMIIEKEMGEIEGKAPNLKPEPIIIGFSGNVTENSTAFVGDFQCVEPHIDAITEALKMIVVSSVDRYHHNNGGQPTELVIYFTGCSDGEMPKLLEIELPGIRSALQKRQINVALTAMLVSKVHNLRIMPENPKGGRATDQNIKPGTAVDQKIVHAVFAEFYLNSHQTLQGTAKVPKYTVLVNDQEFDIAYLEKMSYALSYGHQIVSLPTSTPTPVYVAGRYAERGAMILHNSEFSDNAAAANQSLTYSYSQYLGDKRINA
ncbi:hypothetical protein QR680_007069 [Steinernema hermaphroditum]|uniref:PAZ domain-containing protein n=1 Tax=Steinernema hermaphroditum TaxID=289476 RepID=A0AA39HYP9_9BILA|nr:hypothetical protein QR680_007069 [Steinernema hermaphroditum]